MNTKSNTLSSPHDDYQILPDCHGMDGFYPLDRCLHELIEDRVRQSPDAPALRFAGQVLSYAEMNERANRCAHYLQSIGAGPDRIVAVLVDRSLEMVIALLAILKSGGAYLPLDPGYPGERLALLVADAGVGIVLTEQKYHDRLEDFAGTVLSLDSEWAYLEAESCANPGRRAGPDDLAYVIYTSGSTGKPKGCMLSHRAICNRLLWMQRHYRIAQMDRILQKTPYTFDVSVWELFLPLLSGASMVIARPEGHKDNRYLAELIRQQQVTVCHFVPSMLRFFLNQPEAAACTSLSRVFASGEALAYDLVVAFMQTLPAELHNLYGPTEAAVDVTYWACELRADQKVPIGRPISNIQIYVLDPELRQLPVGESGELYIGGVGLARGYLNRPELTQERFIENPFSGQAGAKLYKTGDKARYLDDGNIEYLGRLDFQVKLRGFRIELGEIEATLRNHEAVADAVVLVKDQELNDPKLVAYLVGKDEVLTAKQVRDFVKQSLPEYMVPNHVVFLPVMPVTRHGKADRDALPWPLADDNDAQPQKTALNKTTDGIVDQLLADAAEILGMRELNQHDDLFDAGATSFTLVRLVDKIHSRYGIAVPIEIFLNNPSVAALADFVGRQFKPGHPETANLPGFRNLEGFVPAYVGSHFVGSKTVCADDDTIADT
ncbi:MAG: amino acid adenylation domain-containing protein, partial [Methylovulum sp.]